MSKKACLHLACRRIDLETSRRFKRCLRAAVAARLRALAPDLLATDELRCTARAAVATESSTLPQQVRPRNNTVTKVIDINSLTGCGCIQNK